MHAGAQGPCGTSRRLHGVGHLDGASPLKNLGEKIAPMKGMKFIQYFGLWGSRTVGPFAYFSSGYWGPAYNETGMERDHFVSAWCAGMKDAGRHTTIGCQTVWECYPSATIR